MPQKKRTAKKAKNVLTRGRTTKQPKEDPDPTTTTTTATDETDDNASERQASPERKTTAPRIKNKPPTIKPSTHVSEESDKEAKGSKTEGSADEEDKGLKKEESWEDLPNLIDELMVRGKGDCSITYITNTREHRRFELDARKELLEMHIELESLKNTLDTSLRVMRNLCPDVRKGKVSEAIKSLGYPITFKDFVVRLSNLPSPTVQVPNPRINIDEPIFEESDTEIEIEDANSIPYTATLSSKKFPSPAKMAKFYTPKQQSSNGIFQFGTHTKGLSTNKAARLPKPGEIVYSEGGSPILQRRIIENHQTAERVEIVQPDGTKYEVDIVFRGTQDVNKIRGFKEFARDVRGIAASRATSVRQNRVQPPKILKAGPQSQSASKGKKPEWR